MKGDIWSAGFTIRCGRVSYEDDKDELMGDVIVIVRPRESELVSVR